MRIFPSSMKLSDQMETIISTRRFPPPQDNIQLETEYTGISAVDKGLVYLVVAFSPAALAFDKGFWLLLMHFLVSFAPVVGVWAIEARRRGNGGGKWRGAARL